MPELTLEQKQAFTRLRQSGVPFGKAVRTVTYKTHRGTLGKAETQPTGANVIQDIEQGTNFSGFNMRDIGSGLSELAGDVVETGKEIVSGVGERQQNVRESFQRLGTGEQGLRETLFQTAGNTVGTVADIAGSAAKGLAKSTLTENKEQQIGGAIQSGVQSALNSEIGKTLQFTAESLSPRAKANIGATANLLEGLTIGAGAIATKAGGEAIETVGRKALADIDTRIKQKIAEAQKAEAELNAKEPIEIAEDIGEAERAGFSLTKLTGRDKDIDFTGTYQDQFIELADRGFNNATALSIPAYNASTKSVASKMLDLSESISDPKSLQTATTDKYAIDLVAEPLVNRFKALNSKRQETGKQLDEVARSLEGQKLDTSTIDSKLDEVLNKLFIERTPEGTLDIQESTIKKIGVLTDRIEQLDADVRNLNGDALKAHKLKKELDNIIDFGKTQEGLSGDVDIALKDMRRTIDDSLDAQFSAYNDINTIYSEQRNALNGIRDYFGTNKQGEFNIGRGASGLRRAFGRSANRADLLESLARLDTTANKYGIETPENLTELTKFANVLEEMYGSNSLYGLQDEVRKATNVAESVADVAQNPLSAIPKAIGATVGAGVGKVLKQSNSDKAKALRDVLSSSRKPDAQTESK